MATFAFTSEVVTVHSPFRPAVQLPLVQVEGRPSEEKYFQCVTTNHALKKLIVEDRFAKAAKSLRCALLGTDILKQLKLLKDEAWKKRTDAVSGANSRQKGKWRAKVLAFPATVDIVAPKVSTVESKTLTVQLTNPCKGLVMLLTSEALEYLRAVVTVQLDNGGAVGTAHVRTNMSEDDRVETGVENLYWSYVRKQYRAMFDPPETDGIKQPRRQYYTNDKDHVMTFVQTGVKSEDNDVDHDTEHQSPSELPEAKGGDGAASPSTTI